MEGFQIRNILFRFAKRICFGLALCALSFSLSCAMPRNSARRSINSSQSNVNAGKDPLTLPAPTKDFVVGKWQRVETAPGDWVFEFRRDGTVTFTAYLFSTKEPDIYEGTYHYSSSATASDGLIVFRIMDGEPMEQPVGYDVRLSEAGEELVIASIERGDRRVQWNNYRRVE